MNKQEVLDWLERDRLVPVVRAPSEESAFEMIDALLEGGISIFEVTMTVPGAIGVIQQVAAQYGDQILLGAGTVLNSETAQDCIDAGAQFIVSPSFDLGTVQLCYDCGVVVAPGALTPNEVFTAWQAGADIVKVFPCDAMGGPSYLKSLKAPFPEIVLMPTGGVTCANIPDFIRAGAIAVGVGSNLVDPRISREELILRAKTFRQQARLAS